MHWSNIPPWSGSYLLVLFFNLILFLKLLLKYIVDLQCCISFKYKAKWFQLHTYMYIYIHMYIHRDLRKGLVPYRFICLFRCALTGTDIRRYAAACIVLPRNVFVLVGSRGFHLTLSLSRRRPYRVRQRCLRLTASLGARSTYSSWPSKLNLASRQTWWKRRPVWSSAW